jgi:hypothetical protein
MFFAGKFASLLLIYIFFYTGARYASPGGKSASMNGEFILFFHIPIVLQSQAFCASSTQRRTALFLIFCRGSLQSHLFTEPPFQSLFWTRINLRRRWPARPYRSVVCDLPNWIEKEKSMMSYVIYNLCDLRPLVDHIWPDYHLSINNLWRQF